MLAIAGFAQRTIMQTIKVSIDIAGQIADQTGIPKERVANYLADEFMKIMGFYDIETGFQSSIRLFPERL